MPLPLTFFTGDYNISIPKPKLISVTDFFNDGWHTIINNNPVAFDFETSGLDIKAEIFWARCVSFHNDDVSVSVQIRNSDGSLIDLEAEKRLFSWLSEQHNCLIAHNYLMDGGVIKKATGSSVEPKDDTYVLYRYMATEHYDTQTWGLDSIVQDVFDHPPYWEELYSHLKDNKLTLSQMCHADWNILGWYNQLDSFYTWEFWKVAQQVIKEVPEFCYLNSILQEDQKNMLMLQLDAYDIGLSVDKENLLKYSEELLSEIDQRFTDFISHPKIKEQMELWNKLVEQKYYESKPIEKTTKSGKPHMGYINQLNRWENSKEAFLDENKFNIDSPDHLRWLAHQVFDIRIEDKKAAVYEK